MLQVANKTPFVATLSLFPDEHGIDTVYPILKATFDLKDGVSVAEEQPPVVAADEYSGEPGQSTIVRASEVMPVKPATDVVLVGHAYAPGGEYSTQVDVGVKISGKGKTVRVYGDRVWTEGVFGNVMSDPVPFQRMELTYERAFGGSDLTKKGEPAAYEHNSIGRGYRHPNGRNRIEGMALPNLEDPENLIKYPNDKPRPACFAPVCPNWMPRLSFVGTYDKTWEKKRAPYLPDDFDAKFYNVASPELIFNPYLTGGELVEVENAIPEGRLQFTLPKIEYDVTLRIEGSDQSVPVVLDTVFVEPDDLRLTMLWRGRCSCDKNMLKMELATFRIRSADSYVKGLV